MAEESLIDMLRKLADDMVSSAEAEIEGEEP
jgi:hypothetical protein